MHLFAEILRGMTSLATPVLDEIRDSASYRRVDSESVIGPSDEEGETDTVYQYGYDDPFTPIRSNSLRPSYASTWETRSGYETAPATQSPASARSPGYGYFPGDPSHTVDTIAPTRTISPVWEFGRKCHSVDANSKPDRSTIHIQLRWS
jgi:hypothetical protein